MSSILRWLQAPPQDADPIEVQTYCLLLLGQWVTGELYRPLSKAANIHSLCTCIPYQQRDSSKCIKTFHGAVCYAALAQCGF